MTKSRDLANAATALNAVTATELGFVDGVTSAIQTQLDAKLATATAATTYVANSLADAKGDLLTATADNTPARLAVGSNGDTLVADSSTSTGLRYTAGNPIPNPVINSNFSVWQRGTSFTPNATTYTADRWQMYVGQTGTTVTRQATSDTTNLAFIQYCMRVARDSGNTGTNVRYLSTPMETVNSIPYAGKTVTFSFYARKGANFSGSLLGRLFTGTGTDQNPLVTYTGYVSVISETLTLTTTWQRFTYTATLGTTATEMTVGFDWTPTGTAGAADYFEVTGVQVDIGSVALPYRPTGATFQGELAACQRYFSKSYDTDTAPATATNIGGLTPLTTNSIANGFILASVRFPVQMRISPTITIYSRATGATTRVDTLAGGDFAAGSGTVNTAGQSGFNLTQSSGATITPSFNGVGFQYSASAEL